MVIGMSNSGSEKHSPPIRTQSRVQRGGYSTTGPRRERNEDAFALPAPCANERSLGTLLAVADGVGGRARGAAASRDAVHYLHALYYANTGLSSLADRLKECVEAVNALNRYKKRINGSRDEFLTTLVAAVVHRGQIWVANVGDSRAYLVSAEEKQIRQLTEDNSEQTLMIKNGASDAQRNGAIRRAIGLDELIQVDLYHYAWRPGDRLILCTDGLASLPQDELASAALENAPDQAAQALVERAIPVDGSDNCTAVVAVWTRS